MYSESIWKGCFCMTFQNKFEQRDLSLPDCRNRLLSAIEHDLVNDNDVLALFYGGSIGNENTDLYSDIDLRVVVKPEKLKAFISNKKTRPKNWGNVLFIEDTNPNGIYTVVHYDCFVKVDTFYYKPGDIHPSTWLKNIKIVKDTNGFMAETLEQSSVLNYEPTIKKFELWRGKFFAYLHEAYRRSMREEYYYALNCIDNLRLSMSMAWYMDKGIQPNALGDWAKYEGERSELDSRQQRLLQKWACGRNQIEIFNVMEQIVYEFENVHRSLCQKLNVNEDANWVRQIVEMVV